jgi:hypothetical protein
MRNADRLIVGIMLAVVLGLDRIDRYRLAPPWLTEVFFIIVVATMIASAATRSGNWHRVELGALWCTVALGLGYNTFNLWNVIHKLVFEAVQPSLLFYTAVTIWVNNVLIFTLLYWLLDGGGPDARARGKAQYPDFDFPAATQPERVRPDWQPGLADYFFLGFTTATAFSPTEALPLTARAKLLMVAEATMSLLNIAIVGARAINIIQ